MFKIYILTTLDNNAPLYRRVRAFVQVLHNGVTIGYFYLAASFAASISQELYEAIKSKIAIGSKLKPFEHLLNFLGKDYLAFRKEMHNLDKVSMKPLG